MSDGAGPESGLKAVGHGFGADARRPAAVATESDNLRTQTRLLREQLELSQQQHQAAQAQIQELESCRLKLQHTVAEQALAASDNLRTQTHQLREQLDLAQQQHQAALVSRTWRTVALETACWWKRLRHPFAAREGL